MLDKIDLINKNLDMIITQLHFAIFLLILISGIFIVWFGCYLYIHSESNNKDSKRK